MKVQKAKTILHQHQVATDKCNELKFQLDKLRDVATLLDSQNKVTREKIAQAQEKIKELEQEKFVIELYMSSLVLKPSSDFDETVARIKDTERKLSVANRILVSIDVTEAKITMAQFEQDKIIPKQEMLKRLVEMMEADEKAGTISLTIPKEELAARMFNHLGMAGCEARLMKRATDALAILEKEKVASGQKT